MDNNGTQQVNKFDFGGYWTFRGHQDLARSISLNAFNGNISLAVWDRNAPSGTSGPLESIPLTRELSKTIVSTLQNLLAAQPNTTFPISTYAWVRNSSGGQNGSGKFEKFADIKFIKDERQIYYIEVLTPKMNGAPLKSQFRSGPIMIGPDEIDDAAKSALNVQAFIDVLEKEVPMLRVASCFNKKKGPNNRSNTPTPPGGANVPSYSNGEAAY